MSYEKLSLKGFIDEFKEVTHGAHPRKFCFILGAGASRNSGIKSGQELVKIWDKDLRERNEEEYFRWRTEKSITDENMSNHYSEYYEKRFNRCRADGYNYIEKIMEMAKPSAGYVLLAHILTATPHNVVITTNFDHLTEDALNYYAHSTPLVIGHESLAHYVTEQPVRPTIIKIHRDLLFDPKSRTEDVIALPDNWRNALSRILANYHPVFIGYAGNDKSLMDFLLENAPKFACDEWKYPYWMLYKNDGLDGSVKDFLSKSNGYWIPHNGFDDVLLRLGAQFGYKTPTEDDFLEDAKERYKKLIDAINNLSTDIKLDQEHRSRTVDSTKGVVRVEDGLEYNEGITEEDKNDTNEAIKNIINPSSIAMQLYREAVELYRNEQYDSAADVFRKLILSMPDSAQYHYMLGKCLAQLNNEAAVVEYKKATEFEPQNEMYHFVLADYLEEQGKYAEALKVYQRAAELEPNDAINVFYVGKMLEKIERYEEALEWYRKAMELEPDGFNAFGMASVLEKLENYEEALKWYQKAMELEPDGINAFGVANVLERLENYEEALEWYQKAMELEPDDAMYIFCTANILEKLGRNEEALEGYKKVLQIEPNDTLYILSMAAIFEKMERYDEALIEYNKALELDPTKTIFRDGINRIKAIQKERQEKKE